MNAEQAADEGVFERVYALVRQVPAGSVTTYGTIARVLGNPGGARQVGWALAALHGQHDVPAQRVVNARGELSGGWAFGGAEVQRSLLEDEGVSFDAQGRVRLDQHLWLPTDAEAPERP